MPASKRDREHWYSNIMFFITLALIGTLVGYLFLTDSTNRNKVVVYSLIGSTLFAALLYSVFFSPFKYNS